MLPALAGARVEGRLSHNIDQDLSVDLHRPRPSGHTSTSGKEA